MTRHGIEGEAAGRMGIEHAQVDRALEGSDGLGVAALLNQDEAESIR
jgi:hypothetical protein